MICDITNSPISSIHKQEDLGHTRFTITVYTCTSENSRLMEVLKAQFVKYSQNLMSEDGGHGERSVKTPLK